MNDPASVEDFVKEFGEQYRKLIVDSLNWLAEREPQWGLSSPIDKREFISGLVERVRSKP